MSETIEEVYTMMFEASDRRTEQLLGEIATLKIQNELLLAKCDFLSHKYCELRDGKGKPARPALRERISGRFRPFKKYIVASLVFTALLYLIIFLETGVPPCCS